MPALTLAVAGCDLVPSRGLTDSPIPVARPDVLDAPDVDETRRSDPSRELEAYYLGFQRRFQAEGKLRVETRGIDLDAETLARNFELIALRKEYERVDGSFVQRRSETTLRRWEEPVRIELHFGDSVDAATRTADRDRLDTYVSRLRRITGQPIDLVASGGNLQVFVASLDEQPLLGPQIGAAEPRFDSETVNDITLMEPIRPCAIWHTSLPARPGALATAVSLVRAEPPDLIRLGCYHEEIAQGLGLVNDSPDVRPSIFNDDEEFALLTRHDELLLQILYDPRLSIGMTAEEARPIVREIASELVEQRT